MKIIGADFRRSRPLPAGILEAMRAARLRGARRRLADGLGRLIGDRGSVVVARSHLARACGVSPRSLARHLEAVLQATGIRAERVPGLRSRRYTWQPQQQQPGDDGARHDAPLAGVGELAGYILENSQMREILHACGIYGQRQTAAELGRVLVSDRLLGLVRANPARYMAHVEAKAAAGRQRPLEAAAIVTMCAGTDTPISESRVLEIRAGWERAESGVG